MTLRAPSQSQCGHIGTLYPRWGLVLWGFFCSAPVPSLLCQCFTLLLPRCSCSSSRHLKNIMWQGNLVKSFATWNYVA